MKLWIISLPADTMINNKSGKTFTSNCTYTNSSNL